MRKMSLPVSPSLTMLGYAALGALALWVRLKYGASVQASFEQFVDDFGTISACV
jgi:hypothetical protein